MPNAFDSGITRDERGRITISKLARGRGDPLGAVTLTCLREKNWARICKDERFKDRNLVDTAHQEVWLSNPYYQLYSGDRAGHKYLLDTTDKTYDLVEDELVVLINGCS